MSVAAHSKAGTKKLEVFVIQRSRRSTDSRPFSNSRDEWEGARRRRIRTDTTVHDGTLVHNDVKASINPHEYKIIYLPASADF